MGSLQAGGRWRTLERTQEKEPEKKISLENTWTGARAKLYEQAVEEAERPTSKDGGESLVQSYL